MHNKLRVKYSKVMQKGTLVMVIQTHYIWVSHDRLVKNHKNK